LIKFVNVSHSYNNGNESIEESISNINLDIEDGDFIAIIGSNGSGKSTFAKHVNGLLLPSEGDVIIDNCNTKDKEHIWNIRKKVGMVFQNPDNQLVATTVEDDIAFGLENIGLNEKEMQERVKWALKQVDMLCFRSYEPHLLSGGQKQKIVIAGALAMRSSHLILDEPTSMLDPKGRKEVLEIVKKLNKEKNITIVYITHFMSEAVMFDKIVVFEKGKIVLTGSPKDIFLQKNVLDDLKLEIPQITRFARLLNENGLDIPINIIDEKEMLDKLCLLI